MRKHRTVEECQLKLNVLLDELIEKQIRHNESVVEMLQAIQQVDGYESR